MPPSPPPLDPPLTADMVQDLASGPGWIVLSSPLHSSHHHKSRILCPLNTLTPPFYERIGLLSEPAINPTSHEFFGTKYVGLTI